MYKIVSILSFILFIGINTTNAQCYGKKKTAYSQETQFTNSEQTVKVFYFHNTHRCATCRAVETVTKETLKDNYGKKVPFQLVNIEKSENKMLAKKYGVAGQTLLIVGKGKPQNITNVAFMNARTHPEKLKAKIGSIIGKL